MNVNGDGTMFRLLIKILHYQVHPKGVTFQLLDKYSISHALLIHHIIKIQAS